MSALLLVSLFVSAAPAPGGPHRLSLGVEALHWAQLSGPHPDYAAGTDEAVVWAPAVGVAYGYRLAEWFEVGLDLGFVMFNVDPESAHSLRYAATGRFVLPLLAGRLELSALLGAGGAVSWRATRVSAGGLLMGGLGIRGVLGPVFQLFLDARAGAVLAPARAEYGQREATYLQLLVGWGWAL